jgi:hypothetical protein
VLGYIDLLAERNLFTPNYGAKKVVRALREEFSVDESLIPPDLQLNNHLSYCRTSRLNHTNMIDVVEAQLGRFVLKVMKGTVSPLSTYVIKIVKGGKFLNVWDVPLSMFFFTSV